MKRAGIVVAAIGVLALTTGCVGGLAGPSTPQTAEAYCATWGNVGYGNFFYCGTSQANLQNGHFPDGSQGFCQTAMTNNIGLVGYIAYTYSGGYGSVESQSDASAHCNLYGNQCPGYIRCTRQ